MSIRSRVQGEEKPPPTQQEVIASGIDRERYRAVPFYSDGKPGPAIELCDLFAQFFNETRD